MTWVCGAAQGACWHFAAVLTQSSSVILYFKFVVVGDIGTGLQGIDSEVRGKILAERIHQLGAKQNEADEAKKAAREQAFRCTTCNCFHHTGRAS